MGSIVTFIIDEKALRHYENISNECFQKYLTCIDILL